MAPVKHPACILRVSTEPWNITNYYEHEAIWDVDEAICGYVQRWRGGRGRRGGENRSSERTEIKAIASRIDLIAVTDGGYFNSFSYTPWKTLFFAPSFLLLRPPLLLVAMP